MKKETKHIHTQKSVGNKNKFECFTLLKYKT